MGWFSVLYFEKEKEKKSLFFNWKFWKNKICAYELTNYILGNVL